MKYLDEVKQIINEYSRIRKSLENLEQQAMSLDLQKKQIEIDLASARESEASLIDKIKRETGEDVDFYQILQSLN